MITLVLYKNKLPDYKANIVGSLVVVALWAILSGLMLLIIGKLFDVRETELAYLFATIIGTSLFLMGHHHVTGIGLRALFFPSTTQQPVSALRLVIPIMVVAVTLKFVESLYVYRNMLFGADAVTGITTQASTVPLHLTLLTIVSRCITTPIAEELLFRGIVLRGLLQRNSAWLSVLLSSLLFGMLHIGPSGAFPATCGGLLYGWLYWRFGSVVPCILAHGASNLFVWAFHYFPYSVSTTSYLTVVAVSVVFGIIGIYYLHRITASR